MGLCQVGQQSGMPANAASLQTLSSLRKMQTQRGSWGNPRSYQLTPQKITHKTLQKVAYIPFPFIYPKRVDRNFFGSLECQAQYLFPRLFFFSFVPTFICAILSLLLQHLRFPRTLRTTCKKTQQVPPSLLRFFILPILRGGLYSFYRRISPSQSGVTVLFNECGQTGVPRRPYAQRRKR